MRAAIHGHGRMGRAVERVLAERDHTIAATFDHSLGIEASALSGVDVVIDFSVAAALDRVVGAACAAGVDLVIGTTGWYDRLDSVRDRCVEAGIGVVWAANFSPGANLLFALARRAAELFVRFESYDAGIEERHHAGKKDAPSGTAIRVANEVGAGSDGRWKPSIVSSRVGSEFGLHTLFFDSPDDLVEISHRARGREGFARGAVIAGEMIRGKKGFFGFDELVGLA